MYAPVLDELFKRNPRDLAANGVEAGDRDGLRRVVNDEVAAGERFDGTNVAALSSYDTALHLVVGERYDGDGYLAGVVGGAALDGGGDNLAGALVGLFLIPGLDLAHLGGHLVRDLGLYIGDEVLLGLLLRVAGDFLEHF